MATSGDTSVPANIGDGSFYFMLDKYGLTTSVTSAAGYNIASHPLYFVRSGWSQGIGAFGYSGSDVVLWYSTTSDVGDAYRLFVDSLVLSIAYDGDGRWPLFSLRCLAVRLWRFS